MHVGRGGKAGDRKSKMDKGSGRAKKGGAGGKYVWGALLDEENMDEQLDIDDPNYGTCDTLCLSTAIGPTVSMHQRL
eukprot:scaffold648173_cov42-Prasinocladus_malaysianus.AAC.1